MNSIHFGSPENKKTQSLLSGVVSGIGDYGNSVGIPTVGGETKFNSTYNENILVNAMAIGHANKNKIFYSKAKGLNKPVVYVGSKTGRDGIHGATMASTEFDENSEEKINERQLYYIHTRYGSSWTNIIQYRNGIKR